LDTYHSGILHELLRPYVLKRTQRVRYWKFNSYLM